VPEGYESYAEPADNQPILVGFDWDMWRWTSGTPRRDQSGSSDSYAFGSAHASTWRMAMLDGSVRALNYSINLTTHRHLSHRADGEAIDAADW